MKQQQKVALQNEYRRFLEQQAAAAEEQRRANRMTKEEKKINFGDLQVRNK